MKHFRMKAAAAAVALSVAGIAQAAVPTTDLVLVAFNYTDGESFIFDTGISFTSLTSNQSVALGSATTNSTAWTTFLSNVGSVYSWTVATEPTYTGTGTGTAAAFTVAAGSVVPASYASTALPFTPPVINSYFGLYTASAASNGLATDPGGVILRNTTTPTNWGGDNIHDTTTNSNIFSGGQSPWVVTTTGTGSMSLYSFSLPSARNSSMTNTLVDTVTLSATGLTFTTAAVPEPGTYALMLAGLLAVGTVMRRRLRD